MKKIPNDSFSLPAKGVPNLSNLALVSAEKSFLRRLIRDWLDYCRSVDLSPKTISDYESKVFKFWWWWDKFYVRQIGEHPENITIKHARAFVVYLREPDLNRWGNSNNANNKRTELLSPASIGSYGRTVKTFFSWLAKEGIIDLNPFSNVKFNSKRKEERTVKTVEEDDLARIFAWLSQEYHRGTFAGCRNLAIFSLFLDSGMRRGELLSMRIDKEWLDLERNRCLVSGKTGERLVVFGELSKRALAEYIHNYRMGLRTGFNDLWLTPDGTPVSYETISMLVRQIKQGTGVDFHVHKLRHTFATSLAHAGVSIYEIKEMMGHRSTATTEIYFHKNPDKMGAAYRAHSPLSSLAKARPEAGLSKLKRRRGKPAGGHQQEMER